MAKGQPFDVRLDEQTERFIEAEAGRTNVVLRIPGELGPAGGTVVHGHLDVVPAPPEGWTVDPFGGEVRDGHRASSRDAKKRKRRDVFVYFDNDMKVRAPFDAMQLAAKVQQRLMARIERAAAAETHAQG